MEIGKIPHIKKIYTRETTKFEKKNEKLISRNIDGFIVSEF